VRDRSFEKNTIDDRGLNLTRRRRRKKHLGVMVSDEGEEIERDRSRNSMIPNKGGYKKTEKGVSKKKRAQDRARGDQAGYIIVEKGGKKKSVHKEAAEQRPAEKGKKKKKLKIGETGCTVSYRESKKGGFLKKRKQASRTDSALLQSRRWPGPLKKK